LWDFAAIQTTTDAVAFARRHGLLTVTVGQPPRDPTPPTDPAGFSWWASGGYSASEPLDLWTMHATAVRAALREQMTLQGGGPSQWFDGSGHSLDGDSRPLHRRTRPVPRQVADAHARAVEDAANAGLAEARIQSRLERRIEPDGAPHWRGLVEAGSLLSFI